LKNAQRFGEPGWKVEGFLWAITPSYDYRLQIADYRLLGWGLGRRAKGRDGLTPIPFLGLQITDCRLQIADWFSSLILCQRHTGVHPSSFFVK
jgi:hypothetical protein